MKTQIKLAFLICTTVLTHALSAQTHKKAASNCIMYDDYVKAASKTKNAVSNICRVKHRSIVWRAGENDNLAGHTGKLQPTM